MKRSFLSLILIFALAILFVSGCSTPERNVVGPVPTGTALPATVPPTATTIPATSTPTFAPETVTSEALVMQDEFALLGTTAVSSPDGRRIAVVRAEPKRRRVLVNGVEQQAYDDIVGALVFSMDSQRLAYIAAKGDKQLLVLDGKEGPPYDPDLLARAPVFSPDSQHVAYIATKGSMQTVVVDDQEGKSYEAITSLTFRPDSQGVAFWAKKDNRWVLVVNSQEEHTYDQLDERYTQQGAMIGFSPDSKHMLYRTQQGTKHRLVVDGVEGAAYDEIASPVFSPDGTSIAYGARTADKWVIVLNNHESTAYDAVTTVVYSPDSKHLMYFGRIGSAWTLLLDGHAGNQYEQIQDTVFSSDSQHAAYTAKKGGKWLVVKDGEEQKQYETIYSHSLSYSPDSRHLAFAASINGKALIVLDGMEGTGYTNIGIPVFSPDSNHVAYAAQAGAKSFMVLDGKEGAGYDTVGAAHFDSPTRLHFLAFRNNQVYLVEETLATSTEIRAAVQQTATAAANLNATAIAGAFPTQTAYAAQSATNVVQATQTAQAAPTATALAKAQMVATAQAAPVVNPAKLNWKVILSDSFDTIGNDWTAGSFAFDYGKVAKSIANGKYTWTIQATKPVVDRDLPTISSRGDMEVSVDARHISGARSGGYGLVFRDDYRSFYYFMIADDQTYKFGLGAGPDVPKELRNGKSGAIKPGTVNHITVVEQGSNYSFFVNNQFVLQVIDDTLTQGVAGPVVELLNAGDSGVFEFDNFEVRVPGTGGAPTAQMPIRLTRSRMPSRPSSTPAGINAAMPGPMVPTRPSSGSWYPGNP